MKRATYVVVDKHDNTQSKTFDNKSEAKVHRNTLQALTKKGMPLPVIDNDGNVIEDPRPVASNWRYKVVKI